MMTKKLNKKIRRWCNIAHVIHDLKHARIGLMGHVLETMYDMYVDPALITKTFGCHVLPVEPDEVLTQYKSVTQESIDIMRKKILDFFDTPDPKSDSITFMLRQEDLDLASKSCRSPGIDDRAEKPNRLSLLL